MAEAFKNRFHLGLIERMGDSFKREWGEFDRRRFVALASDGLDDLELKQRSMQILSALEATLPEGFPAAAELLVASLHPEPNLKAWDEEPDARGICGWAVMPMADYVAKFGQSHLALSMQVLKEMTCRFTAEFAIRPFLDQQAEPTLKVLATWLGDPNVHVRRLISEGTRPRLPWGMRLQAFDDDPSPMLPFLLALRDDPEEYVRRSVANHLNDISKRHPGLVAELAGDWMVGSDVNRQRLLRHACRSLIKAGHLPTLEVFGYGEPVLEVGAFTLSAERVKFGEVLEFEIELRSSHSEDQRLMIDYVVHHQKANGTLSPKVFKWKSVNLAAEGELELARAHRFKPVTTRVYHSGLHRLEIQINGRSVAMADFELEV